MKKWVHLFSFLALCVLILGAPLKARADEGGYVIRDYQVSAIVHENNTVDVREIIQVEFTKERHGIYRYLPQTMRIGMDVPRKNGKTALKKLHYENEIRDIRVDGRKFTTSEEDGNLLIIIGEESEKVTGLQTYRIAYRYVYPEDRLDTKDFLFHSVLGPNWDAPIDHFAFRVAFDKPLPEEAQQNLRIYSGEGGNQSDKLGLTYQVTSEYLSGEVSNVPQKNAITIYMELPQGYFVGAKSASVMLCNLFAAIAAVIMLAVLAKILLTPKKKPEEAATFYPPGDISSAEVGMIIDETADNIDLYSLIPWWAQKGYLKIEEFPDDKGRVGEHAKMHLKKVGNLPVDAPEYQTELFGALFEEGDEVDLSELSYSFAKGFENARKKLAASFTGAKELSTGMLAACLWLVAVAVSFGIALCMSSRVSGTYNVPYGIVSIFLMSGAGFCRIAQRPKDAFRRRTGWILGGLILAGLFAANALVVFMGMREDVFLSKAVWYIGFLVAFAASVLCAEMIQPTPYRLDMMGRLLGFRHFIETAELPKLKTLVQEDPNYFYQILPFAMVFELSEKWAKQFEKLCDGAPDWYSGYEKGILFNTIYLDRQLRYSVNEPMHDIQLRAGADASSSGGYSGGGGAGGGGGSW